MAGEDHYQSDEAQQARLDKALRESVILRELADLLNSSLDREKILQELAKRTTELCGVTRCAVWLLEETWDRFRPVTYYISEPLLAERMQKTTGLIWQRSLLPLTNPVIQRLLAEGEALYIEDLRTEPTVQPFAETFLVHSVLLLALVRDGRPMGMMSLDDPAQTRTFSSNVQRLGRTIAQQTTIALDNIRLFQQAQAQQRRAEQLIERAQTIYHVAMAVNSNEELSTVLKLATEHLVRILGASNGLAMRLNTDERRLLPVDSSGPELPANSLFLDQLPSIRQILESGTPALVTSEQATEEELPWFRQFKLKSLLIVPLMADTPHQSVNWDLLPGEVRDLSPSTKTDPPVGARCVGLVAIHYTKRRKPTSGEFAFAQDIAAQCALAIEKAHLLEKAHQAAELANERARTLDAVFQAMTEGIGVIDPNGEILIRNHAAARFLNIPPYSRVSLAHILQRYPTYTIDGRPYTYESFPLQEALNGSTRVNAERLLTTRNDGVQRVLEITATPLKDASKRPVGLVAAFRDVTSQIEAEQRIHQALDAFLHIAEAVSHSADIREALHSTLAKTLTTLHCRRGMVHLLPQGQQVFSPLLSLGFSPDEEARWLEEQQIWLSPEKGQAYEFYEQIMGGQTALVCATNTPVSPHLFEHTMVLASPIKHGEQILGLILLDRSRTPLTPQASQTLSRFTNWDITIIEGIAQLAGVAMEQARWQQEALEAKISENAMREIDTMKNEFMAITAHEFRNPLAVILMHSQHALRKLRSARKSELPETTPYSSIEEHLETIASQSRHLNNIVSTFLDTTRLNQGQFTLRKEIVNLGKIAVQVVEDQIHLLEDCEQNYELRYAFRPPTPPYLVQGDFARLFQIISNLVENAVKYSPFGGLITVTLSRSFDEEIGETIEICVADQGIGIPPEAQERLFERFYRVPGSASKQTHGIGLGLYIVAQLVRLHGGKIRAESSGVPGEGSRFIIHLPAPSQ